MTSAGDIIKKTPQILDLLTAIWLPEKVAIIHCKAHQKGDDPVTWGNNLADISAKEVAIKPVGSEEGDIEETTPTLLLMPPTLSEPVYTQKDLH